MRPVVSLIAVLLSFSIPNIAFAECEKAEGSKPLTKRVDCLSKTVGEQRREITYLKGEIAKLQNGVRPEWAVACVNAVCVGVHSSGVIVGFNKHGPSQFYRRVLDGTQSPLDVECHLQHNDEICTVVDGAGKLWFGYLRDANSWKAVDGGLKHNP